MIIMNTTLNEFTQKYGLTNVLSGTILITKI